MNLKNWEFITLMLALAGLWITVVYANLTLRKEIKKELQEFGRVLKEAIRK